MQAEVLVRALTPDLYRVNAFRMAQLPATASQRDISRRLEKLTMLTKLGGGVELPRGPLSLQPAPDLDAVRHAVERLRDPETRLVDEFFWFWPETPAAETPDEALAALDRGDVAAARKRWQAVAPGGGTAVHNLAVLAHLLALDLEHRALASGRNLDS